MACGHIPGVICDSCREFRVGFMQVHPHGCLCEFCRPAPTITTTKDWAKELEKLQGNKSGDTWQCPGCKTYYGPKSIGYCECEKKHTTP